MYLDIRQICLVAGDKARTVSILQDVLDIPVVHGSGDLSPYGLPARGPMSEGGRKLLNAAGVENLVFALGNDFLEVLFPFRPDATSERYRQRRGGDTGYMVIFQSDDVEHFAQLARREGVRVVHEARFPMYQDIHLHTRDTGGALLSVARHLPENVPGGPWYPAGTAWETMPRSGGVNGILGIELQSDDPELLAARWSRLLGLEPRSFNYGFSLALEQGELRFVEAQDGRGEGFSGFDLGVLDRKGVLARAREAGLPILQDGLEICGMRCRLLDQSGPV